MMSDPEMVDRGEKLLWSGKPDPRRYALVKSWLPFLVGTAFFAISALWVSGEIESRHSFAWYDIPFLVIGPASMLSPVWYFFQAKRTSYALTDRRAVIDPASLMPVRTSVLLGQITLIETRPRGNGSGNVYVHHTEAPPEVIPELIKTIHRDGFVAVPEARRVEQLLRNAIDTHKRSVAA